MARDSSEGLDRSREGYGAEHSEDSARLGALALGDATGVNGYTTLEEASRLREELDLSAADLVLDLGSGRGWPGILLSRDSGCRIILTDVPPEALRQAAGYIGQSGVEDRVSTVCAEGSGLPFQPGSFDAVSHADVFC